MILHYPQQHCDEFIFKWPSLDVVLNDFHSQMNCVASEVWEKRRLTELTMIEDYFFGVVG
jgi:hypothetical protein